MRKREIIPNHHQMTEFLRGQASKMVNTWWVFGEVSKELDYHIFNAEVENIGYKRTKRGIKVQANDLYRETSEGEIIVDDGKMESILDYMREIDWSEEV